MQDPPGPDEDVNFYAQSLVLIGNLLYEQSQITAAAGQDGWKDQVRPLPYLTGLFCSILTNVSCCKVLFVTVPGWTIFAVRIGAILLTVQPCPAVPRGEHVQHTGAICFAVHSYWRQGTSSSEAHITFYLLAVKPCSAVMA